MYSNNFSVNKNFQSSVNLELDLGKDNKIEEYIPTSNICDVIKKYIKTALGLDKDYATTLVGPYGKGKSFLLLVLSFLLGKNKDSKAWSNLTAKIQNVDNELYELLLSAKKEQITLLPVLINSNYDNVLQSFQIALNDALKREGLNDVVPESVFDICLDILGKWQSKDGANGENLKKCLEANKINLADLKNGLREFSQRAYKDFESLYNCLNIGLNFNPLVSNDIVKTYRSVTDALKSKGFTGIFIIFDEFSKFLESNSADLMKDLKIIQDFAELASRSSLKTQIHFCCVTHKSISLYKGEKKPGNIIDAFKTVEGRFKEVRFNRSLDENYQMIAAAIIKKSKLESEAYKYLSRNQSSVSEMDKLPAFKDAKLQTVLFEECFPLNPLTVYALIHVSELVAQNERTFFTFLSDADDDSFNSFLHSQSEGLFNVDKIYDYFSQLFKRSEDEYVRDLWYRSESVLSKLEDPNEKRIIKILAVILIINNPDDLPANEKVLSLSSELDEPKVAKIVASLTDRHFIRKNLLNNLISFSLSSSKQIDEAIEVLKKTKCKNLHYCELADQVNEKKYVLPRRYNEENKITRFYKTAFFNENELLKIASFNYYFENNYCDGLIIYLLTDKLKKDDIEAFVRKLNDERVIIKTPRKKISSAFYNSLMTLACLKEAKKSKGMDEMTRAQIDLIAQESETDLHFMIDDYYEESFDFFSSYPHEGLSFNELLSVLMESIYNVKLVFNNELVNKRDVSSQYQRAVNHVIDQLLNGHSDSQYSETSPEGSVYYAILTSNKTNFDVRTVLDLLKAEMMASDGRKIAVYDLASRLRGRPYGVRNGVIPVLLAWAISELSDNAIIYYQQKEIELDAVSLVKATTNKNYQISFAKGSADQKNYLEKMCKLFGAKSENSFRKDLFSLAKEIKRFFIGLPQIVRLCNEDNNFLMLDKEFLTIKGVFLSFDVNPYEAVFDTPLAVYETSKYSAVYSELKKIVSEKEHLLDQYRNSIIALIKNTFGVDTHTSLRSGAKEFLERSLKQGTKPVLEEEEKIIYDLLTTEGTYDDTEYAEKICKVLTNQYIEDWDSDKSALIKKRLDKFAVSFESAKCVSTGEDGLNRLLMQAGEIAGVPSLLKNNLESVMEEFSGSVSSTDKINVLLSMLKELV